MDKKRQKWLEKRRKKNEDKKVSRNQKNKKGSTKPREKMSKRVSAVLFDHAANKKKKRDDVRSLGSGVKVISHQEDAQKKASDVQPAKTIQSS